MDKLRLKKDISVNSKISLITVLTMVKHKYPLYYRFEYFNADWLTEYCLNSILLIDLIYLIIVHCCYCIDLCWILLKLLIVRLTHITGTLGRIVVNHFECHFRHLKTIYLRHIDIRENKSMCRLPLFQSLFQYL